MSVKNMLQISKKFFSQSLGRGMLAYGITFPTGCLIHEYIDKKNLENVNWKKCMRYSFYGAFISAPILFGWVKVVTKIWPKRNLQTSLQKALLEQVIFSPIAVSLFFFTMACFDHDFDFDIARNVLRRKFWDAYKVAVIYWPCVQIINYTFIPDRNRIVFVSLCGLLWVIFLAFVDEHGSPLKPKSEEIELTELSKSDK